MTSSEGSFQREQSGGGGGGLTAALWRCCMCGQPTAVPRPDLSPRSNSDEDDHRCLPDALPHAGCGESKTAGKERSLSPFSTDPTTDYSSHTQADASTQPSESSPTPPSTRLRSVERDHYPPLSPKEESTPIAVGTPPSAPASPLKSPIPVAVTAPRVVVLSEPQLRVPSENIEGIGDDYIARIRESYSTEELIRATCLYNELEERIGVQQAKEAVSRNNASPLMSTLEMQVAALHECRKLLDPIEESPYQWTPNPHKQYSLWEATSSNGMPLIRCEAILDEPLFNILAIINETDLMPKWIPYLKVSRKIHTIGTASQIIHQHYSIPWVLKAREANLYGFGATALKERDWGTSMVVAWSLPPESRSFLEYSIPPFKGVPMHIYHFAFFLSPQEDPGQTFVQFVLNLDPQMRFVPKSVLSRTIGAWMFGGIQKLSKSFKGSIYEERVKSNTALYGLVSQSVDEFYKMRREKEQQGEEASPRMARPSPRNARGKKKTLGGTQTT